MHDGSDLKSDPSGAPSLGRDPTQGRDARSSIDKEAPREPLALSPRLDPRVVRVLRPRNAMGALFFSLAIAVTSAALGLSSSGTTWIWACGQLVWAVAFLQWFVLLHEAAHKTLFAWRGANLMVGRLAGFLAIIPLDVFKLVHAHHHRWTGWRDLDITTSQLTPRRLPWWERWAVNVCWASWFPLFSIVYRLSNYWDVRRLLKLHHRPEHRRRIVVSIAAYAVALALFIALVGPWRLAGVLGPGLMLSLMMQDPLILSQHTHLPMLDSHGEPVRPISPRLQQVYTRSLVFPPWFSKWVLLHFDAHDVHHMYAHIPGYFLDRLHAKGPNTMPWWQWIWRASGFAPMSCCSKTATRPDSWCRSAAGCRPWCVAWLPWLPCRYEDHGRREIT